MAETPLDHSRAEWHPHGALVLNSEGGPRPPLDVPMGTFTVHWTGAGRWADPNDTAAELRGIEVNHAIPQDKPSEYNSASDMQAVTWENAGPFRAAHSSGNNETSWGHLVLLGPLDFDPGDPFPAALADAAVRGVHRARRQLVQHGDLAPNHVVRQHRQMPGASTSCPGPLADPVLWGRVSAPLAVVEFDPERRLYGPWPGYRTKPVLRVRDRPRGDAVRYCQGVLRNECGQASVVIDGDYGPVTAAGVSNLKRLFGLDPNGICGREAWDAIDFVAVTL